MCSCNISTITVTAQWVYQASSEGVKYFNERRMQKWDAAIERFNANRKWWRDRGCWWLREMPYEEAQEYLRDTSVHYCLIDFPSSVEVRIRALCRCSANLVHDKPVSLTIEDFNTLKRFDPKSSKV